MPAWVWFMIFLIPIAGILLGAFSEWLKFKEKQAKLGTSASELEQAFAAQQQALETAQRRIENLEAIVTSQMWDTVHDETLPEAERQRALAQARLQLDSPDEPSDAERVAQMARRLKS